MSEVKLEKFNAETRTASKKSADQILRERGYDPKNFIDYEPV